MIEIKRILPSDMRFFELVKVRHSVRAFAPTPVEPEKLQAILETANAAPSAGNLQAFEILLVKGSVRKRALARAAWGQQFVASAPEVLVFCAHPARSARKYRKRGEELYSVQDATIACTFAMLAVTALGLGAVWVGAFDDEAVCKALQISQDLRPVAILPLGYSAEIPETTSRRGPADLIQEIQD